MEKTNEMTPQQSLEIIRSMMNQSRKDTRRELGRYMVLWGMLVALTAATTGYLWHTSHEHNWSWLWLVMSIVGATIAFYMRRKKQAHIPTSYVTQAIGMVWWSIGIFCCMFGFGANFIGELCQQVTAQGGELGQSAYLIPADAMMMLFFGVAATATGLILKDYFISICGFLSGFGGFVGCLLLQHSSTMPVLACVALISMVIPGLRIILIDKRLCSNH